MADAETLVYIILDVVIALLVITGNVLVCCVIVNSRALRKKVGDLLHCCKFSSLGYKLVH